MNFTDMLSYADIHDLGKIASNYDCQCSSHSKNELIQSILAKVGCKDVLESQVAGLPIEDIRFLNSMLFEQRDSFSLEELVARVSQTRYVKDEIPQSSPREVIAKFKQRGWLFNGFSQQTKYLFHIPQDLKSRFGDTLAKQFRKELNLISMPDAYRDELDFIAGDTLIFLGYLRHQEVSISAEGYMYKRNLSQVLESMSVVEEPIGKITWRFGYGRRFKEYPSRFSLIYDFCYYHQLIQEVPGKLVLTHAGEALVEQKKQMEIGQIYRFWLRLYKGPIHNLSSIVHWIAQLTGQWVTAESLGNVLGRLIKPYYYDSPQDVFEQRIVQMMMHLGLLKVGESERHGKVLQISKLGRSLID